VGIKRIIWRITFFCAALAACGAMAGTSALCQTTVAKARPATVPALLLSDFHFDPFHDPGKVQRLVNAPASAWNKILAEPASADQAAAFTALQRRCGARGVDTPYALLQSVLHAARTEEPHVRFITVSGDFVAHGFSCRFAATVPGKTQSDYAAFVAKTIEYVTGELRQAFPGVPIYAALGNNDSGCGDYRLDGGSDFLASAGKSVMAGLPSSARSEKQMADFTAGGYYSVTMAAPVRNTRLIVLDDLSMSTRYTACSGQKNPEAAAAQLTWLRKQLAEARQRRQRVWVMGHIPPGVDIYSTFAKMQNVCGGAAPQMFLASDELDKALVENADVIRLGLFAHTHMDESRLLPPEEGAAGGVVAIKMVPSISPVNGNNPSFTVARVDAASATLVDYAVFAASNQTGVDTAWAKEYDYAQTYRQRDFSPAALQDLAGEFRADPDAKTAASQAYIGNFFVGDSSSLIKPLWPQYVCALSHPTARGFTSCMCPPAQ
jgi:sphingomyelin phosphodiesterase acid-like 3